MNRRSFLKLLPVGAVAAPSIVESLAAPIVVPSLSLDEILKRAAELIAKDWMDQNLELVRIANDFAGKRPVIAQV